MPNGAVAMGKYPPTWSAAPSRRYRRSWRTTLKATVDGAVYALFTGVVFASMWPR